MLKHFTYIAHTSPTRQTLYSRTSGLMMYCTKLIHDRKLAPFPDIHAELAIYRGSQSFRILSRPFTHSSREKKKNPFHLRQNVHLNIQSYCLRFIVPMRAEIRIFPRVLDSIMRLDYRWVPPRKQPGAGPVQTGYETRRLKRTLKK